MTTRFFDKVGVKARIIPSHGATEAKVPDIVDAIVDLTETGTVLRKHGLKIIETLLVSRTELIANAASYADPEKRAAMDDIALLLQGAIRARGQVLLKLNVARRQAAGRARRAALDGLADSHGAGLGRRARGRVGRGQARRQHAHPGPQGAGARDILELPITKIVE